jgi:hypothetical protein
MKPIGKDGKVWRLSKESWDLLQLYDSDPNVALKRIQVALDKPVISPPSSAPQPAHDCHPCRYDEGIMVTTIQDAIRTTLESFRE